MMDEKSMNVVYELNGEMYENAEMEIIQFEYISTGFSEAITFLGYPIWCSENDDREWDEETDTPEPLYDYVKREAIKLIEKLQTVLKH